MDRIRHFALFILAAVFMLTSCSGGDSPKYHPNIQAYTSGTISRYAAISISFTEDLPAEKQTQEFLSKNIKLSPSADVTYAVSDNYIVTIQPKESLKRDTEYTVRLDMDNIIEGLDSDLSRFEFTVHTLPLLCHGRFGALEINAEDDSKYDVPFTLVTADSESASDAESLVTFSERVNAQWSHDATGRIHTAQLTGIEAGNSDRQLKFSLKNSGDYPSEGVRVIPDKIKFSVYDITVKGGSERCVNIYFTKNLDMEQDIKGLAYIDGNTNERVQIEKNCLKLYYDEKLNGQINIFVNKGIKSSKGLALTESMAFQRTLGDDAKPYIGFVSQGVILPLSSNLTVQFKSVYMRGVVVRVIEVPQRNMAQFIQASNLDDNSEMRRVGRLVNQ
ncbi:MAG: Ig-like domain-containing protein, partial [Paludibacteraceae bacterium]|nr:Ig-like domain-containing protein [Paludibacteraceae bacterium]